MHIVYSGVNDIQHAENNVQSQKSKLSLEHMLYVSGCSLLHCKEYSKDMQFLVTSPYYNPTTYTSCESIRNIILDCITSHNHKEDIYISSS